MRIEIMNDMADKVDTFFESLKKDKHPEIPTDSQEIKNIIDGMNIFLRNYVPLFIDISLKRESYPAVLVKYCQRLQRMKDSQTVEDNYLFDLGDYYTVKKFYQDNLDEFSLFIRSLIYSGLLPYNFDDKDLVMIDFAGDEVPAKAYIYRYHHFAVKRS